MRYLRMLAVLGVMLIPASYAQAQRVVVGVGIGVPAPAPVYAAPEPYCAYGYYDYAPYACAPYGYYGPEWFRSGVFIGIGPWFHGYYGGPVYRGDYWRDHGYYVGRVWHPVFRDRDDFRGRDFDRDHNFRDRDDFRANGRDWDDFRGRDFDRGHNGRDNGFRGGNNFHDNGRHEGRR